MALALVIIFALLFIASYVLMPKGILRILTFIFSLVIMIGSLVLITAGDNNHYGMKKVTVTETKTLKPASDIKQLDTKLLIKNPLGTKDESVIVYKDNRNKTAHTQADKNTDNKFVRDNKKDPQLKVTTTKYVYKNNFFKVLYAGLDNNNVYQSRKNEFIINDDWIVLTPKQASSLQTKMKDQQAKAKPQMEKLVKQQVTQAMMANPSMTKSQQKQLIKKITQQAQQKAMDQTKKELQKMSIE